MDVCTQLYGNPCKSFRDISVWIKVLHRPTDQPTVESQKWPKQEFDNEKSCQIIFCGLTDDCSSDTWPTLILTTIQSYESRKKQQDKAATFSTHLCAATEEVICTSLHFLFLYKMISAGQTEVWVQTDNPRIQQSHSVSWFSSRMLRFSPFVHIRVVRKGLWEANRTLFLWPHGVSSIVWQWGRSL